MADSVKGDYLLVTTGPGALEKCSEVGELVDLLGHCIFCLEPASPAKPSNVDLEPLHDILPYIQPKWNTYDDLEHFFVVGKNTEGNDILSRVPPLCESCRLEAEKIAMFHEKIVRLRVELENIQKEAESVSVRIRKKMKDTHKKDSSSSPEEGRYSTRRKGLFDALKGSNIPSVRIQKTEELLDRLRDCEKSNIPVVVLSEGDSDDDSHFHGVPAKVVMIMEDPNKSQNIPPPSLQPPSNRCDPNNRGKLCEVCGAEVLVLNMYQHMYSHIGEYTFKCPNPECNHAYLSRWSQKYYNHLKKAGKCVIAATGKPNLSARKLKKICQECGEECDILHRFASHIKTHETALKNFTCPIQDCGAMFTIRQSVECHLHFEHDRYKTEKTAQMQFRSCHICQEKVDKQQMASHLETVHNVDLNETLQCKKCSFVCGTREEYINHLVTHAKVGIECDICPDAEVYFKGYNLREHYFVYHQIGKKLQCDLDSCSYTCFTELNLAGHKFRYHKGRPSKPYICNICDPPIEYSCKSTLTTHNIRFHGAKKKQCHFCPQNFFSSDALNKHEKEHRGTATKLYHCTICKKSFRSKSSFNVHQFSHSTEKPFKCNECFKCFKQENSLRQHKRIQHLGIRHLCQICGKDFSDTQVLKTHLRIHTGERPYVCNFCGLKFRQQSSWRTHVKAHETKGENFVPKGTFERTVTKGGQSEELLPN